MYLLWMPVWQHDRARFEGRHVIVDRTHRTRLLLPSLLTLFSRYHQSTSTTCIKNNINSLAWSYQR